MTELIIRWDAYDFMRDYQDVAEWRASFLFTNELKTLIDTIEKNILKGKLVVFNCEDDAGKTTRIICVSGKEFVDQIIINLESSFCIRKLETDAYRIDLLMASNIEEVLYATPIRTETLQ